MADSSVLYIFKKTERSENNIFSDSIKMNMIACAVLNLGKTRHYIVQSRKYKYKTNLFMHFLAHELSDLSLQMALIAGVLAEEEFFFFVNEEIASWEL